MVQFKLIVLSIFSAAAITPAFGLPSNFFQKLHEPIYYEEWAYFNPSQFLVSYGMIDDDSMTLPSSSLDHKTALPDVTFKQHLEHAFGDNVTPSQKQQMKMSGAHYGWVDC